MEPGIRNWGPLSEKRDAPEGLWGCQLPFKSKQGVIPIVPSSSSNAFSDSFDLLA